MLRDRGTIKWTSLMLPEHVELLKEMWQEDTKVQKPELDAQEIEMMNQQLYHAYHHKESVRLSVYKNGEIITITGHIKQMNQHTETIKMVDGYTSRSIAFRDIIEVMTV